MLTIYLPSFPRFTLFSAFYSLFRVLPSFPRFTLFSAFYPLFRVLPSFPRFTLFSAFYPLFRVLPSFPFPLFRFRHSGSAGPFRSVSAFYPYPLSGNNIELDTWFNRVAKKLRARGHCPRGRFTIGVVSEEGLVVNSR